MSMNLNTSPSQLSLCDLPDDVLVHILSFIPTVDSVATSILSTRWIHLWKHVPILSIDEDHLTRNNAEFANMVSRVLSLHAPKKLEKLSLSCFNHELYDVRKWVHDSIMRGIQSLDLCVYCNRDSRAREFQLPESLFTCKTLEALKLQGHILVVLPTVVCLPKLKTMALFRVKYDDYQGESLGKLISSCSSLESLVIEADDSAHNYSGFDTISSSTLRVVEFRLGRARSLIGYNPQIFCTALQQLNLKNCSENTIKVPSNVFTCETLELIVLDGNFDICGAPTICLPNLRFLTLRHVAYRVVVLNELISSSTSLESLDLEQPSLTVKFRGISSFAHEKVVINSPTLKYLKLDRYGWVAYHIDYLPSLEQADVTMDLVPIARDYCSSSTILTNVYQALRHVKSLKICQSHSIDCTLNHHSLPMFNRLTELDITICRRRYAMFQELIKNSAKLEHLSLRILQDIAFCERLAGKKVVINAPTLKYLKLDSSGWVDYHIEYLASLEEAEVTIDLHQIAHDYCSSSTLLTNVYQALRHVKSLKICGNHSVDCALNHHSLPIFNRLTELDITIYRRRYGMLQELIKNSAQLEHLSLRILQDIALCERSAKNWKNPNHVPACLLTSLTSMSISGFSQRYELKMIKYILKNARIMEKMEVSFYALFHFGSGQEWEAAKRKILNSRRASENCVVLIK